MPSSVALSVIVPAFNEVNCIANTIAAIQTHLDRAGVTYEVIVAADGRDGTRERAAALAAHDPRVTVFGSEARRGKGLGIRLGVERARGDVVGFLDADLKTPIEELDKLLPWFDRGFDVVIGSRASRGSQMLVEPPLYRRLGSRVFSAGVHALVGLREIRDTQCGFKFFRAAVARDIFGRQRVDGYMFDVEVLHLAQRRGYRIKEVGVNWYYDGDSRLGLAELVRDLIDLVRIRFGQRDARSARAEQRRES